MLARTPGNLMRSKASNLSLASPALVLMTAVCMAPIGVLFVLSFFEAGQPSLAHYARIFESPVYLSIFGLTVGLSVGVTVLAMIFGYPLCYFIYCLPRRYRGIAIILVTLPLWTSILVRTYAWLILLQRKGAVNALLMKLGLVDQPLPLVFNLTGAMIGMFHIVLPLFILPVYSSMVKIDRSLLMAAASLGAGRLYAFWKVFLPLTYPGVMAGGLLVFIYALGFYITPQVLGGGKVVTISMKVAENTTMYSDWGAASSLGLLLLVFTGFFVASLAIGLRRLGRGHA